MTSSQKSMEAKPLYLCCPGCINSLLRFAVLNISHLIATCLWIAPVRYNGCDFSRRFTQQCPCISLVGASLSEPYISELALHFCLSVCLSVSWYGCCTETTHTKLYICSFAINFIDIVHEFGEPCIPVSMLYGLRR